MTFLETFSAVFLATVLGQVVLEAYNRWAKHKVVQGFDHVDKQVTRVKEMVVPDGSLKCPVCNGKYTDFDLLNKHLKTCGKEHGVSKQ